nr:hypothetical protein GCM10020185_79520 [Pseudomonas brassicacearum subsp. brassicacearum]
MNAYWQCFSGIVTREWLRFVLQRTRLLSALVRPLLWLVVFAAGFRAALGIAIIAPYDTYIPYEVYIVPGLACMILLFNGMQGSLSMVYDREMGSMRVLLTSPLPRAFLLASKLLATSLISLLQVYAFLAIAWLYGIQPPTMGLLLALPALLLVALMLSALGLLLSNAIRQLENFAGVMNFVIFPDVLPVFGTVPAMENAGSQPLAVLALLGQPVHPRRGVGAFLRCTSSSTCWRWRCAWG